MLLGRRIIEGFVEHTQAVTTKKQYPGPNPSSADSAPVADADGHNIYIVLAGGLILGPDSEATAASSGSWPIRQAISGKAPMKFCVS